MKNKYFAMATFILYDVAAAVVSMSLSFMSFFYFLLGMGRDEPWLRAAKVTPCRNNESGLHGRAASCHAKGSPR